MLVLAVGVAELATTELMGIAEARMTVMTVRRRVEARMISHI
jgi:hypothetical protein